MASIALPQGLWYMFLLISRFVFRTPLKFASSHTFFVPVLASSIFSYKFVTRDAACTVVMTPRKPSKLKCRNCTCLDSNRNHLITTGLDCELSYLEVDDENQNNYYSTQQLHWLVTCKNIQGMKVEYS